MKALSRILLRILQVWIGLAAICMLFGLGLGKGMAQARGQPGASGGLMLVLSAVIGIIAMCLIGAIQGVIEKLKTPEEKAAGALRNATRLYQQYQNLVNSNANERRTATFKQRAVLPALSRIVANHPSTPEAEQANQMLKSLGAAADENAGPAASPAQTPCLGDRPIRPAACFHFNTRKGDSHTLAITRRFNKETGKLTWVGSLDETLITLKQTGPNSYRYKSGDLQFVAAQSFWTSKWTLECDGQLYAPLPKDAVGPRPMALPPGKENELVS